LSIAREGYPFIFIAAFLALLAFLVGLVGLGLILGLFALAFVGFFRDPKRNPPTGEELILSPADGKIVEIKEVEEGKEGFFGEHGTRISIFLSALDVHVNRAPVDGRIEKAHYQEGKYFPAYKEEASRKNEQNALQIIDPRGRMLSVVQIAGIMARRIVCYVKEGDSLEKGQKFGMIMFGSRVDLFLPGSSQVEVVKGQHVRGGETVIARFV